MNDAAAQIARHDRLYYDGSPEVSDRVYDQMVEDLRQVEPGAPVLSVVGDVRGGKIEHRSPMLSIRKIKTADSLEAWAKTFDGSVLVSAKVDGLAVALHYGSDGQLEQAVTRGSGKRGRDITASAFTIADIPQRVEGGPVEVRGEIYCPLANYDAARFASPRSAAAAGIQHRDPEQCRAIGLAFMGYALPGSGLSASGELEAIAALGLCVVPCAVASRDDLPGACERLGAQRGDWACEADGICLRVESAGERDRLGTTSHHPRGAVAVKFATGLAENLGTVDVLAALVFCACGRNEHLVLAANVYRREWGLPAVDESWLDLHHVGDLQTLAAEADDDVTWLVCCDYLAQWRGKASTVTGIRVRLTQAESIAARNRGEDQTYRTIEFRRVA